KKCLTRAAVCEKGVHWIHYKCDRLSALEITRMQNDQQFKYACKICELETNTNVKKPCSPESSTGLKTVISPISTTQSQNTELKQLVNTEKTQTQLELPVVRKHLQNIPVNDKIIQSQTENTELKQLVNIEKTQTQLKLPVVPKHLQNIPVNDKTEKKQTSHRSIAFDILQEETDQFKCGVSNKNTEKSDNVCDKCNSLCHQKCLKDNENNTCIACAATDKQTIDRNTIAQNDQEKTSKIGIDVRAHVPVISNNVQQVPDTISLKQRELRQLELKLRRWEDELKMREQKNAEVLKDHARLEEYTNKTEARNHELEQTIRTLQRKIVLLESKDNKTDTNACTSNNDTRNTCIPPHTQSVHTSSNDELIIGVRDQVTQFIMRKVANQITELERHTQNGINSASFPAETQSMQLPMHSDNIHMCKAPANYDTHMESKQPTPVPEGNGIDTHVPEGNGIDTHVPEGNDIHVPEGNYIATQIPAGNGIPTQIPAGNNVKPTYTYITNTRYPTVAHAGIPNHIPVMQMQGSTNAANSCHRPTTEALRYIGQPVYYDNRNATQGNMNMQHFLYQAWPHRTII
ncbi:MAG: hypothetical protein ABW185_08020, partial [Sedimenticola sp.]